MYLRFFPACNRSKIQRMNSPHQVKLLEGRRGRILSRNFTHLGIKAREKKGLRRRGRHRVEEEDGLCLGRRQGGRKGENEEDGGEIFCWSRKNCGTLLAVVRGKKGGALESVKTLGPPRFPLSGLHKMGGGRSRRFCTRKIHPALPSSPFPS